MLFSSSPPLIDQCSSPCGDSFLLERDGEKYGAEVSTLGRSNPGLATTPKLAYSYSHPSLSDSSAVRAPVWEGTRCTGRSAACRASSRRCAASCETRSAPRRTATSSEAQPRSRDLWAMPRAAAAACCRKPLSPRGPRIETALSQADAHAHGAALFPLWRR